jgi:hypothetical protein
MTPEKIEWMGRLSSGTRRAIAVTGAMLAVMMMFTARAAHAEFGFEAVDQQITANAQGEAFTQAGGHPYDIVTAVDFNGYTESGGFHLRRPDADAKDIVANLSPGLVGNPAVVAQCTDAQLAASDRGLINSPPPECPVSSQVGTIELKLNYLFYSFDMEVPVYNMVPPVGEPAKFGFKVLGVVINLYGYVRSGGDFGVTVASENIPIALPINGFKLTIWGVPADPSHDIQRCKISSARLAPLVCSPSNAAYEYEEVPHPDPEAPKAFLTMPTSCGRADSGLMTNMQIDSWQKPGVWVERDLFSHLPPGYPSAPEEWGAQVGTTGCEVVPFKPGISVEPTNHQADTPTGLNVEISLPQDGLTNPKGIATADVKKAIVTLPAGESISPSAADGLGGCSLEQIGLHTGLPAECPDSSKLGTVELDTPLLNSPLSGSIYLGEPECAPCSVGDDLAGRMVKLYVVVEGHGVILKLPGHVELDPSTGRIQTTFDNNPQLPFDHLKLNFKAGPRSPLVNPHTCGTFETTAELTPWSGNPPAHVASAFQITSGPEGKPCPTSTQQGFNASFVAGTTNNQAGAFSPMTVTFSRSDGEQQLGALVVKTPPGLLGSLSAVSLCPEPAASEGSCPGSSEIGTVTVAAGAGANPFYVTGGKMFITTGYGGAPFGLSVVVPAKAGPFNLGTVVVRGAVSVDPTTAALTVTMSTLPTILDGIPLDLRTVNVDIGKSGFMFNPTNCNPMSLSGVLTGGLGAVDTFTNGFQATNCRVLGFKPGFHVSTSGKTSRADGASLDAELVYPKAPFGTQSNIAKVKVSLPKRLPSRLTTLQKACTAKTFQANPSGCPAASRIGTATATTPILPVPLSGPVYFVSHGGEAFPDLVVVLQGYGVTVDLVGTTFINKAGITSTTFETVPDVPVDTFELKLPQGRFSALAANGNLCVAKLTMPTSFTAQDGAEMRQSTPIAVSGCAKHSVKAGKKHAKKSKHVKKR